MKSQFKERINAHETHGAHRHAETRYEIMLQTKQKETKETEPKKDEALY